MSLNSYQYIMLCGAKEIKEHIKFDEKTDDAVTKAVTSYMDKLIRELSQLQNKT